MLRRAHTNLLMTLARQHAKDMRATLRLARACFNESHPTVATLICAVQFAEETVREIESDQARSIAA